MQSVDILPKTNTRAYTQHFYKAYIGHKPQNSKTDTHMATMPFAILLTNCVTHQSFVKDYSLSAYALKCHVPLTTAAQ
jgi:hypothetical protein